MKNITTVLLILVSLLTNAQSNEYIEPELKDYVYEALREFQDNGVYKGLGDGFVVKFSNVKHNKATAIARGKGIDSLVHIIIYKDRWKKLTYAQKKLVILHELGHDYFNMEHSHEGEDIMMADVKRVVYPSDLSKWKKQFYINAKKQLNEITR